MKRALLLGMVLALCSTGAYEATAKPVKPDKSAKSAKSAKPGKPVISVKIDEGTPRYVYEKKHIECSSGAVAWGCTHVSPYMKLKYDNIQYAPDGSLGGLELQFGLKDVMIEISTEVEKGSCEFDVVVKHELTHLNLHRRVLKHYAAEIAKSVLAALDRMPSYATLEKRWNVIEKVIDSGLKRMRDDMDRKSALIDKDGAHDRSFEYCYGKNGN